MPPTWGHQLISTHRRLPPGEGCRRRWGPADMGSSSKPWEKGRETKKTKKVVGEGEYRCLRGLYSVDTYSRSNRFSSFLPIYDCRSNQIRYRLKDKSYVIGDWSIGYHL
uniref:Uncharacterized protein n=1 Tax=Oryza sativa subsp. japonica TaxID=39947 RepID=Q69R52_ORYSJ|nr:hypothetical protein [Oryza sativa Japonica Group]